MRLQMSLYVYTVDTPKEHGQLPRVKIQFYDVLCHSSKIPRGTYVYCSLYGIIGSKLFQPEHPRVLLACRSLLIALFVHFYIN